MKPHFYKVPINVQTSYSVRHDILQNFGTIWHYHPELELHSVIRGEGVRFIGDNISNFSAGEIVLLGQSLPHTWRCNEEYFKKDTKSSVEAVVIHFLPHSLGKDLLNLPEAFILPKLFEKAKRGMVFYGKAKQQLACLMELAVDATGLSRLSTLLSMLSIMADTDEFEKITSAHSFYQSNEADTLRLNKIYNYTLKNFKKEIKLEEIAAISNLSTNSFCRYFKLMTKKTYSNFVIELRLSHACRMLIEDKLTNDNICFDCGFNNVSNFYRHFKQFIGITPLEYKRKYLNSNPNFKVRQVVPLR